MPPQPVCGRQSKAPRESVEYRTHQQSPLARLRAIEIQPLYKEPVLYLQRRLRLCLPNAISSIARKRAIVEYFFALSTRLRVSLYSFARKRAQEANLTPPKLGPETRYSFWPPANAGGSDKSSLN